MKAPGTCVDCGNDAYIKLAGDDDRMVCAHCFAARSRRPQQKLPATPAGAPTPSSAEG